MRQLQYESLYNKWIPLNVFFSECDPLRSLQVASVFDPKQACVCAQRRERTRTSLAPKTPSTTTHPTTHTDESSSTGYWPGRSHSNCPSGVCAISLSSGSKAERVKKAGITQQQDAHWEKSHMLLICEEESTNPHTQGNRHTHTSPVIESRGFIFLKTASMMSLTFFHYVIFTFRNEYFE